MISEPNTISNGGHSCCSCHDVKSSDQSSRQHRTRLGSPPQMQLRGFPLTQPEMGRTRENVLVGAYVLINYGYHFFLSIGNHHSTAEERGNQSNQAYASCCTQISNSHLLQEANERTHTGTQLEHALSSPLVRFRGN